METLSFVMGADFGKMLMLIAQEQLIYKNNIDNAIKILSDFPIEIRKDILIGDLVVNVDEEKQVFVVSERSENDNHPKLDVYNWCKEQSKYIDNYANSLIKKIDEIIWQLKNKKLNIAFSYDEIIKFINGNDDVINDILKNNEDITYLEWFIVLVKKFIEKSIKTHKVISWLQNTYPNKFNNTNENIVDYYFNLITLIKKFQSLLKGEWNNVQISNLDTDINTYIENVININETLKNGIKPVNILDNYSAGWLAPDGTFYGLNGDIANMLHNQIAEALQGIGIIPMYENEEKGIMINPDAWLEQNGWIKIRGNNIEFAGCLNYRLNKRNVDLTKKQIDVIVEYISNCHQNIISVGWKNKEMEVEKFKKMTINNLTLLYDNYFNY